MSTGIRHNAQAAERQLGLEFDAAERLIARGIQRMLVATDGNLRTIAPVDKGLYRAAWDLSADAPSDFKPEAPATPGRQPGSGPLPELVGLSNAQEAKTREMAGTFEKVTNRRFFFTNNLEYASAIEDGHSTLAPSGVASRAQALAERDAAALGVTLRG